MRCGAVRCEFGIAYDTHSVRLIFNDRSMPSWMRERLRQGKCSVFSQGKCGYYRDMEAQATGEYTIDLEVGPPVK